MRLRLILAAEFAGKHLIGRFPGCLLHFLTDQSALLSLRAALPDYPN